MHKWIATYVCSTRYLHTRRHARTSARLKMLREATHDVANGSGQGNWTQTQRICRHVFPGSRPFEQPSILSQTESVTFTGKKHALWFAVKEVRIYRHRACPSAVRYMVCYSEWEQTDDMQFDGNVEQKTMDWISSAYRVRRKFRYLRIERWSLWVWLCDCGCDSAFKNNMFIANLHNMWRDLTIWRTGCTIIMISSFHGALKCLPHRSLILQKLTFHRWRHSEQFCG